MNKTLIIGPSWVGDAMLIQPMLIRIKKRQPHGQIDVFAPPWTIDLLRAMPEINKVIPNPFPHGALELKKRYQLGLQLRKENYDHAIILPSSLKSALIPFFARIPVRTGYIGEARFGFINDVRFLNKKKLPLMVERFAQLAERSGYDIQRPLPNPKLTVNDHQRQETYNKLGINLTGPVAVFCPGAEYGPAKRWPIPYFAELAQRLSKHGYTVLLIGSAKDREIADKIVSLGNDTCINLCGSTDLSDAIALLSRAQLVVSNDSGLMHLTAALDRPMLALFGSSSPQFTPPLSSRARILKLDLRCSPCFKRECPLGHFECMKKLTPEYVWKELENLQITDHNKQTHVA